CAQAQVLVGRFVTNAQLSVGSILLLDFAEHANSAVDAYVRVESAWLLQRGDSALVGHGDERESMIPALAALAGDRVAGVEFERVLQMRIVFSSGLRVAVFPSYVVSADYDNWTLGLPSNVVYTAGPGAQLVRGSGDQP